MRKTWPPGCCARCPSLPRRASRLRRRSAPPLRLQRRPPRRDRKGRVRLTRTWRICFVPRPTAEIDLKEYLGVRIGMARDAGYLEWLICLQLLIAGILPGIVFYILVINTDRHYVVLTRE